MVKALAKFFRTSQARKRRGCEQVAAVCFRIASRGIEFLLVQTRGRRWTFPKGGTEPGLTYAQAAAREAFEEAGVHGRIEKAPFAHYSGRKRPKNSRAVTVHAYLCEVSRLETPQESHRKPAWFSADKAKRCLRGKRTAEEGAQLDRVVDRAVARIGRLRSESGTSRDALQKVRFEAFEGGSVQFEDDSVLRYVRRRHGENVQFAALALDLNAYLSRVLRSGPVNRLNGSGPFLGEKDSREIRPDRAPAVETDPRLRSARPAMRLPQADAADAATAAGPNKLEVISSGRRWGTGAARRKRGSA